MVKMRKVILYTKKNCPLCDEAKYLILTLEGQYNFELEEIDIYQDDQLLEKYQLMIPVVEVDGTEVDFGQIQLANVMQALE